jgi:pimeloyl-ACP methyl ester carboxylesterase
MEEKEHMARVTANGIHIEYETFGEPASTALLLIIGLSNQLIEWDDALCENMAKQGYHVIRFDNRDSGLSARFEAAGRPDILRTMEALMNNESVTPPYTLEDMADDAAGLLDALGIEKAHICGMSMGGMIAQTFVIRHPARAISLTSIYSTTGNPDLPGPEPQAMEVVITPPPEDREEFMEHYVKIYRTFAGAGIPFDEEYHRKLGAHYFDRAFYPEGTGRQLMAIMLQENRKTALSELSLPTLVIHGDQDPLVPFACGKDTAEAVPGSKLMIIEGMGHELPIMNSYWVRILEAVVAHIKKAQP